MWRLDVIVSNVLCDDAETSSGYNEIFIISVILLPVP